MKGACCFPRTRRLTRASDFRRVIEEGETVRHPLILMRYLRRRGAQSRAGFSVGRQVGKAWVRCRVKRRLKEAYRLRQPVLKEQADLFFVAREAAAAASYHDLDRAVGQLLSRAGLLASDTQPQVNSG